jgi:hypothetical protein
MEATENVQGVRDEDHLKLLSIFYFISAGLSGFFALFPLVYAVMGVIFLSMPESFRQGAGNPPPAVFGWVLFGFGIGFTLLLLAFAVAKLLAGFAIRKRRHRLFVLIVAGFSCLSIPYGTLLGVFTFIVLGRPSVSALFVSAGHD